MTLNPDFIEELRRDFTGEIRPDLASRVLYSTDASIYQIEPLGVVLPRTQEDLQAAVTLAAKYRLPILPRGAGTSLAGQAIGPALILDCSRWLDRIVEIDPEGRTAVVEPGVILSALNRQAGRYGLQFGPDPASAERATMGGVICNNATGAHSILYGMAADHVLSGDVILSDGSQASWGEIQTGEAAHPARSNGVRQFALMNAVNTIREQHADSIKAGYPASWRNSAGYRLNYLLPWSASRPPRWAGGTYPPVKDGTINLAHLLAGSEGTLAVLRSARVQLVPKPKYTILAVLAYPGIVEACEDVPRLLDLGPSAVELVPGMLIRLARGIPTYASQMGWMTGDPPALLVVEFSGDQPEELKRQAEQTGQALVVAESAGDQARIWNVRKVGLGLLDSRPQSARPVAFIEDCAIPVGRLAEYVREVERILAGYGVESGIYAHASAGCLHIRPILDLKTARGRVELRAIAEAVLALTLRLGGAMSSEHGDGLARSEWLKQTYGEDVWSAMRLVKQAVDPDNLLNPGKMFEAPKMDASLRYKIDSGGAVWRTALTFDRSGGLGTAIEQCNGQGVCRKMDGVMCPSFQATRDEMYSTRGRANLLRALISTPNSSSAMSHRQHHPGGDPKTALTRAAAQALDLCLACKGCKGECPSGVDMAKLKYAFFDEYYKSHLRPARDYLFGYFHLAARALSAFAPLVNAASRSPSIRKTGARLLGITPHRPFPVFTRKRARPRAPVSASGRKVLFLPDALVHFTEQGVEQAAFDLLASSGFEVIVLPFHGAGASLLSKGMVGPARRHAVKLLDHLRRLDPDGSLPIVAVEPPEIYMLKNEYLDLAPERSEEILKRASGIWLLDEFLIREEQFRSLRIATTGEQILYHPHCHQKAEGPASDGMAAGALATLELLRLSGYEVSLIESGCCGMAGTFGYEAEHYDLSQKIGGLKLFPALEKDTAARVASSGAACRLQIEQGTGRTVEHPLMLAARARRGLQGVDRDSEGHRRVE